MKPLTTLLTATLLSAASLTACSGTENGMSIQQQTEQRFKLNPKQAYRIKIKIKINDAPGPLKLMHDMTIRYMARNCSYLISSQLEGAKAHPTKRIEAPTKQIAPDEYETVFYADAVLDEDYFGEGVCRWEPDGFGTSFKASGKPEETAFNISDIMVDLMEKKVLTKYYWKARYPYTKRDNGSLVIDHTEFGSDSINDFSYENQKNLFTITVTLEKN